VNVTHLKKITLVLADDEPVVRAGIRALLNHAEDVEVIGEAENGYQVQQMVADLHPRVLLLDLKMPGPRPAELERWVRENHPETTALVLTGHGRDALLSQMMDAGVSGYLTKNISGDALVNHIRIAAGGRKAFDRDQKKDAKRWRAEVGSKWESLTHREREILKWIALGAQNRFIASECEINEQTVRNHISNILGKLGLDSRQQASLWMNTHFPEELELDEEASPKH
jgi:DNA-binding NarL/FixJ family response regulator